MGELTGRTNCIKEVYRNGSNFYMMSSTQYGISIKDSIYFTSNEGTNWSNITGNLPADILGSGITEFGGNTFIAYGSANEGIYRRSSPVGISDNVYSDLLNTYPNPFNNNIVITNTSNEIINQISIFDTQGKLVLSENRNNMVSIHTSELKDGLYIIEIQLSDNTKIHRKIIKESKSQ